MKTDTIMIRIVIPKKCKTKTKSLIKEGEEDKRSQRDNYYLEIYNRIFEGMN